MVKLAMGEGQNERSDSWNYLALKYLNTEPFLASLFLALVTFYSTMPSSSVQTLHNCHVAYSRLTKSCMIPGGTFARNGPPGERRGQHNATQNVLVRTSRAASLKLQANHV